MTLIVEDLLPDIVTDFRHHAKQLAYELSAKRFNLIRSPRRTGKTAIFKRRLVKAALSEYRYPETHWTATAPTRDQAKRLYWSDFKRMVPRQFVTDISDTELRLQLFNGAIIWVFGMDVPERIEGISVSGGGSDEYGNMKSDVFPAHIRPALADRLGWWDFLGVPEGRNHYYDLWVDAGKPENADDWSLHYWTFAEVAPLYMGEAAAARELSAARRDLDPLTFSQEYEGNFVTFEGRAYYQFDYATHAARRLQYFPKLDLDFAFDFNVSPAVCSVSQEIPVAGAKDQTHCIGEVYIPKNGTTPAVCRKLIQDYGKHEGRVNCYGDASGGNKGTAKIAGSDWDLIRAELSPVFKDRLNFYVPKSNPPERARVNAVNSRLKATDGTVRLLVDPESAPYTCRCLDGTMLLKGGSGEIDKRKKNMEDDNSLSHISDALGYKIVRLYPIGGRGVTMSFAL